MTAVVLTDEERDTLQRWARRPKSSQALAQRSRMVLGCAAGKSNKEVAVEVGVWPQTVCKWRQPFLESRLDGLTDEPRPGAPRTLGDQPALPTDRRRALFQRWSTDPEVHPYEAFVGLAALLHGAPTQELKHLTHADIDHDSHRIRSGRRPHPTPLDPWTWNALQPCLDHRQALGSNNSHLLINLQTNATRAAASDGYVKNTLPAVGIQPRILRSSRLVDLVGTVDAKLVAAAHGMRNEAVITYLADHVDTARLPRR